MTEVLKPCPFCGGEAAVQEGGDRFYVACHNAECFCAVGEAWDGYCMPDHVFADAADAIAAWNTRQPVEAGWQPISSAPKEDGAKIMAVAGDRVGEMVAYTDYNEQNDWEGGLVWRWANDSCHCCWDNAEPQPTHWQPHPTAPQES